MVSNQILQNTLNGLKDITHMDMCVSDIDGNSLASTFPGADRYDTTIKEFVASQAESQRISGFQFFKVIEDGSLEYVLMVEGSSDDSYMIGKLAILQLQNLIVAYKERFDKDSFFKNLLLDNLLLVDIYSRAKKLHIETNTRRAAFIVESDTGLAAAVHDARWWQTHGMKTNDRNLIFICTFFIQFRNLVGYHGFACRLKTELATPPKVLER